MASRRQSLVTPIDWKQGAGVGSHGFVATVRRQSLVTPIDWKPFSVS